MSNTNNYIAIHKSRFIDELMDFLKIPSVSADPTKADDVKNASKWLADQMQKAGIDDVEIFPTAGHPIVYGQKLISPDLPTVLVYGHYDVQPPDPLDLWESGPFDPVIKNTALHPDGAIFARGACDDKGQVYMHIKSFEVLNALQVVPVNIKFMIEGEEEVGSSNLEIFCSKYREKLKCDVVLISDTSILANDTPSITTGLRGLSYLEVEVTGPNRDLHSGVYGGAVANPINVLAKMIASLTDENNRITIPGFYEKVKIVRDEERKQMNRAPFDPRLYRRRS